MSVWPDRARFHRSGTGLLRVLLASWLTLFATWAFALDPARQLSQYHHQFFSPRGAASTSVTQVVQTDDGYLWVGTSVGLYRFDGVNFELVSTLGGQSIAHLPVLSVFAESGGGMWIGFNGGSGAGHLVNGRYTAFSVDDGWRSLETGLVDSLGVTWAVLDHKLVRLIDGGKQRASADWGIPDEVVYDMVIDKAGTLWVSLAGRDDLMYLPQGEHRFRALAQHLGGHLLAAGPDGTIFVSGDQGLVGVTTRAGLPEKVVRISAEPSGRVLADRDGGLLVASRRGLIHVGSASGLMEPSGSKGLMNDVSTSNDGVHDSSAVVYSMTEDRDGNVWVGTDMGLERIRDTRFTPLRIPGPAFSFGVVAGADGDVWAGNWTAGLLRVEGHSRITAVKAVGRHVSLVYRDPTGAVWAGSASGLWRADAKGHFDSVPIQAQLLQPWPSNLIMDAAGSLWLTSSGLVRGRPGHEDWRSLSSQAGFVGQPTPQAMLADANGTVWMAAGRNVVRVVGGSPQTMAGLSTLIQVGAIQTFAQRGGHLWVGGLEGLALVRGDDVRNLKTRGGPSFNQVVAILETAQGDLWVRGADDAWRVPVEEIRAALATGRSDVDAEHFDSLDGLDGMVMRPKPSLAQASDGVVWLGTHDGLAWLDPARPPRPTPVPPLHVTSVMVDGAHQPTSGIVTVQALSRHLEISYTAIDLGYPERIQFRYKLDGFDRDWQSAGTRRVAYYSDLPPGDFHFRFASTDRNGHWHDDDGATLSLRVAPAWFQTAWLKMALLLAVLLFLSLLYRLRMNHVASRLRMQLKQQMAERDRILTARQAERERIARELHDTLIQSTQGLIYLFQGLAERISPDERTRLQLESALVRANEVAAEGRDRIEDLRETVKDATDLPRTLAAIGNDVLGQQGIRFRTIVTGSPKEIGPGVIDAISWIGREALVNACRHAHAESVEIEILHEDEALVVFIRDDGVGLPEDVLAPTPTGHWGIQGMRERAVRIDSRIEFLRRPDAGTEIRLTVPGTLAYGAMTGRFRWRSFERRSRQR